MDEMENRDWKEISEKVNDLAREAGEFIRHERINFSKDAIEYKGSTANLVSYVDKETEKMLVKGLKSLLPEAGFITEEGTAADDGQTLKWIIDPLDGTTNFLHNIPVYSVSIALAREDDIVLGTVYEVTRDECFSAVKGQGAYLNGESISTADISEMAYSVIATGFPYEMEDKIEDYFRIMTEFLTRSQGLRRFGSAAVDLAYVACGRFDGYYEFNINSWDVAAGCLLVKEAGGRVTDFKGGNDYIFGRQLISGTENVQQEMVKVIQKYWF